ncbi:unnamed protein product [Aphanomyces euteiches]
MSDGEHEVKQAMPFAIMTVQVQLAISVAASYAAPELVHQVDANRQGQWKVGVFGCCSNLVPNCCRTLFCPCVTLGQTMARVGSSGISYMVIYGVLYLGSLFLLYLDFYLGPDFFDHGEIYDLGLRSILELVIFVISTFVVTAARSAVRSRLNIPGECCGDCICSCCCTCCVIAQMSTQAEAYTPGKCSFGLKDSLPAYQHELSTRLIS